MCGIIGFISKDTPAIQYVIDGLKILQNRGYDSAGICCLTPAQQFILSKFANTDKNTAIELLEADLVSRGIHEKNGYSCIGHTRWATTGCVSNLNSHPHVEMYGRIALVHNGIIENYKALKDFLVVEGFVFKSATDTEVIVNLISYYLDKDVGAGMGTDILEAINLAMSKLEGTWGIVILYRDDPDHLYLCKKGSPLLIGYDEKFAMVASESTAFAKYFNRYITLRDNEIIKLGCENQDNLLAYEFRVINDAGQNIETSPTPYPHWMLKEIFEQPLSALRAINMGGRILDKYRVKLGGLAHQRECLLGIDNLVIVACGTSYYAGLLGAKYFRHLRCFNSVRVVDAAEFAIEDIPLNRCGMLVLSQSGETKDVHRAMELAKEYGVPIISIVNVVGSLIAREADCGIYLNAGREVAVASTKSFTSQVIVLSLMAIWFAQEREVAGTLDTRVKRGQMIKSLQNVSPNFAHIIRDIATAVGDDLIDYLAGKRDIFILGRGYGEAIAYEGALKIKEIAYLHAEGYPVGALKHGPFALIEAGTPIFILMFGDEHREKIHIAAEEVKSRGAYVILMTDQGRKKYNRDIFDYVITLPENEMFSALLGIMPFQYIAYKLALRLGYNPDFPRNLAKVVTVD